MENLDSLHPKEGKQDSNILIAKILKKLDKNFGYMDPSYKNSLTQQTIQQKLHLFKNASPLLSKPLGMGTSQLQMQQNLLGQPSSQPGNQFSQFGQQPAQQQNLLNAQQQLLYDQYMNDLSAFDYSPILSPRSWLRQRSLQEAPLERYEESKHNHASSISSGLGSIYDYINHRFADGGRVGLGSMGRFFGIF